MRSWFLASYPLLGAFAANFELIEDPEICKRWGIHVAAVDAEAREIYFNPLIGLNFHECQFVMAHEFLHVGLRHQARCQGRDAYIWNLACDYVINDWLIQKGIGEPPAIGLLHDPQLRGLSAEVVYDRIVTDLRRLRKLATFRGTGECDMPYDEGYVSPETIAGRVRVKGRGGTVLQPRLDLLDQAPDFPKTGPVLIITDGACDVLRVRREHGFLIPAGGRLPFPPRGPVFRVR